MKNMGNIDRAIRVVAGLVLIGLALFGNQDWSWIGWIGIVPLLTGLLGRCPAYSLLGINTCPVSK